MSSDLRIIVMEGDETGQELLEQAVRVLDPSVTQVPVELEHYDLSLENRRRTNNDVVSAAAKAMKEARFGLKAATVTPEGADGVGSPNRILREEIDGKVIIRTGRRIPGVTPIAGVSLPDRGCAHGRGRSYGAEAVARGTEDGDEIAYRTEQISRSTHLPRGLRVHTSERRRRSTGRVYGRREWTACPVCGGMLKEELDAAADRHPDVPLLPRADRRDLRRA